MRVAASLLHACTGRVEGVRWWCQAGDGDAAGRYLHHFAALGALEILGEVLTELGDADSDHGGLLYMSNVHSGTGGVNQGPATAGDTGLAGGAVAAHNGRPFRRPEGSMATDLYAEIVTRIAAPLEQWLREQGAVPEQGLAPPTREDAGDLSMPCHRYAKALRKAPQAIASDLAEVARTHHLVAAAEPVAGFLNLRLDWSKVAEMVVPWALADDAALGHSQALAGRRAVIEFSSPNTNKPQHLGHCRNNILGATVAKLARAAGADVVRVNLINDRGIHICKSMVAYQRFGQGNTPESLGLKGDHYVGRLYVEFDKAFKAEYEARFAGVEGAPSADDWFNGGSELGQEAREMLRAWEAGDGEIHALWNQMNGWVLRGFEETYRRMGIEFDRVYLESETYLLGKDLVMQGLEHGVFHRAANGAVVFDLAKMGLEGEKAVLRADGTSVYATQDLGTAMSRYDDYHFDQMVYVVGNEQDYYFKVLFGMLEALRPELKGRLYHLSYGMVELPHGKMKSREGTVVDADDLMDELRDAALEVARGNWPEAEEKELRELAEDVALGGLKFFLLKFAPATTFIFDPAQSIDPKGESGVYCQYAFARAGSILRKLGEREPEAEPDWAVLAEPTPRAVLAALMRFPGEVRAAALEYKPNLVARATYEIARTFSAFFNHGDYRVLNAEGGRQAALAALVRAARRVLGAGLDLMGITPLAKM